MNVELVHNPRDPRVPLTVLEQVPGKGEVRWEEEERLSRKLLILGQKRQGMLSRGAVGEEREERAAVISY